MKEYFKLTNAFLIVAFALFFMKAKAQSSNCTTATPITLTNGSACANGTTVGAITDNTLYGACNSAPVDMVWYTYTSVGPNNTFTVTPGTLTNAEIVVYMGGCPTTAGVLQTCNTVSGSSTNTVPWSVPTGQQVWIGIASAGGLDGTFQLCVTSSQPPNNPGNTCDNAENICSLTGFSVSSITTSDGAILPCIGVAAQEDIWVKFTVTKSGLLFWKATPSNLSTEFDWDVWDITSGCASKTNVCCNYNYADGSSDGFGMENSADNAPCGFTNTTFDPAEEFSPPVTVQCGHTYAIQISNYSNDGTGFSMDFTGSTCMITTTLPFTATPSFDCGSSMTVNINNSFTGVQCSTVNWDFGDGTTATTTGTNNPPAHTYTTPGTYAITATVNGICPATYTQYVQLLAPLAATVASTDETCAGNCDGTASITSVTGGDGTYTYSWSTGGTSTSINGLCAGDYSVTISNAACNSSITKNITINTTPKVTPTFTAIPAFCEDSTAPALPTTSNNGITGTWTPSTVSNTTSGSYTFTPSAGECAKDTTINITVNPKVTPTFTQIADFCTGTTPLPTLSTTSNNGITGAWNPSTVSNTTSGTYTFTPSTGVCATTQTMTVTVNSLPTITATGGTICNGDNTTLTASGGSSYTWSPATGLSGTTGASVTASPTTTTTYKVVGTDANGCVDSTTTTVTVNSAPTVTVNNATICPGSSATLTATPSPTGGTYSWSPTGTTTSSITESPSTTTTYKVTYTLNGCTASDSGTITVNPNLNPIASSNSPICDGSTLNLTVTTGGSGATYSWSGPNGFTSSTQNPTIPNATTAASGTYSISISNSSGCSGDTTITVTVNPLPTISAGADVAICSGTSTTLTASGGSTYVWSPTSGLSGATSASVTANPTSTTTYKVVGTDANSCKDSDNVIVTVNPLPDINAGADVSVCPGTSTTLTASGGTSYTWSPSATLSASTGASVTATPTATTTYTVVGTDANGCVDSDEVTVTINSSLTPMASSNSPICEGTTLNLSVTAVGTATYSWTGPSGFTSSAQNPTIPNASTTNSGVYTVNVSSSAGCSGISTVNVTVNPLPTASFTVSNVCPNVAASFTDNSTISSGSITGWNWNLGDGATSSLQNPNHSYSAAGNYTIKLVDTSAAGCSDSTTQSITVYPAPTADYSQTNVCEGLAMNFTDNSTGNGGMITGWNWDFGDNNTNTQENPSHTYGGAGTYQVKLIATTSDNCSDTVTKTVEVYPNPTAAFNSTPVCSGTPTTFTDQSTVGSGSSITNWNWNFGDTPPGTSSNQNPTYSYDTSGVFNVKLTVTTNNGCTDSITQTVTVNPNPIANFTGSNLAGCTPWCAELEDSSKIESGSITSWQWDLGDGSIKTGQNVTACYTNTGLGVDQYTIKLVVTSDKGCKDSTTKADYVSIYPHPHAAFTTNPKQGDSYHENIHFLDESQGASVWQWSFGDGDSSTIENPTHLYGDTGTYFVYLKVSNQWGCKDSTGAPITIEPIFSIFIPNAFTPDGDGKNDTFYPKAYGIKQMTMYIFDRWGQVIYKGHQLNSSWNGKDDGVIVPPDVYVYKIEVQDFKNHEHTYIGHVTVVR